MDFSHLFQTRKHNRSDQARQYLHGLIQAKRKNMERIEEVVPDSNYAAIQQFVTDSPWDHQPVFDAVALRANQLLGGHEDSCLLLDESGFTKKGDKSVGVARQYNGRLGKVDNCQVGVYCVLGRGERAVPIDVRLYLPKEWTSDKKRCKAAGVPKDQRVLRTKIALAMEMIAHARALGVRFAWVGADGLYGNDGAFLRALEDAGETFVTDVHKDQMIYLDEPELRIPAPTGNRGRRPSLPRCEQRPMRVDRWVKSQPEDSWTLMDVRDSTKGKVRAHFLTRRVWLWDGKESRARCWTLIVRRDLDSGGAEEAGEKNAPRTKYTLSNAPVDTPLQRLVYMQGQRFWVERAFEDGKSHGGMGEYEGRGWRFWHHHMALVAMAMLFMAEEREQHKEDVPLLSCRDVQELLAHFLPRRNVTTTEVIRQMKERHRKRQDAIEAAYRKQKRLPPGAKFKLTK